MGKKGYSFFFAPVKPLLFLQWLIFIIVLIIISTYNYELSQELVLFLSVVIIFFIYSYIERIRHITHDRFLILLSIALLAVGFLDLLNLLCLKKVFFSNNCVSCKIYGSCFISNITRYF